MKIICTCCKAAVHHTLIHDLRVISKVCATCYESRAKERRSFPTHYSKALPPSYLRLVPL